MTTDMHCDDDNGGAIMKLVNYFQMPVRNSTSKLYH